MQLAQQKPATKKTEIGVIPTDWEVKPLGSCASFKTGPFGSLLHRSDYVDGGIPVINPMQIIDSKLVPTSSMTITETAARRLAAFRLSAGDVVIGRRGDMGRCARVLPENHGWLCGTGSLIVTCRSSLNSDYLQRVLSSPAIIAAIENASVGTTMVNLNNSTLNKLLIQIPPTLAEQEAIAAALSDADGLIESLEKLIAKKRQIKHGTMQDLLTGKRRLPEFSGKWETKRFDQMFSNLRNASNSRSELAPHGEVAYVHYGDIHIHPTAFLNPVALQTFIPRAKVRAVPRLMDGDLLLADASEDTTAIGKAVEITGLHGADAVAGLHTMALRGNKEFLADGFKGYIQYMSKVRNALVSLATGVSVYGITKSGVKAIEVTIPKPAEQSAIAAILSDMDAEIAALEAKLAKARHVKQGMMQELLTGRTRLI